MTLPLIEAEGGVQFAVKVVPGSSRDRIVGVHGAALKVTVSAPPERGRANARVLELLAESLGISKGAVTLVTGATGSRKQIRVAGLTAAQLRARLSLE